MMCGPCAAVSCSIASLLAAFVAAPARTGAGHRQHRRPRHADVAHQGRGAAVHRVSDPRRRRSRPHVTAGNPQRRRLPEGRRVPRRAADRRRPSCARSTRRSSRTCSRSRADRRSTFRTTTRSSTTCSRCRARRRFDLRPLPARPEPRQTFTKAGHRQGVLPHPLAHERDDPRVRPSVLHDPRRSTERFELPNVPAGQYTLVGWHERVGERTSTGARRARQGRRRSTCRCRSRSRSDAP